jgi:drug/metabolite transporter (DMT)-like permease
VPTVKSTLASRAKLIRDSGVAAALASAILWGLFTPAAKTVTALLHPLPFAAVVYLIAGVTFLPALTRKTASPPARLIVPIAVFGGFMAPFAVFYGISRTSASTAALLINVEYLLTILIAVRLRGEVLRSTDYIPASLIVAGTVWLSQASVAQGGVDTLVGIGAILVACAAWSIDNNLSAEAARVSDPRKLVALKTLIGGSLAMAGVLAIGLPLDIPASTVPLLLVVGVGTLGISILFFFYAAGRIGAALTSLVMTTQAFWGVAASMAFLGETLNAAQALSGAMLLAGALWLGWNAFKRENGGSRPESRRTRPSDL